MSDIKTHKGLSFKKLYSEQHIQQIIQNIADQLNQYYQPFLDKDPHFQITAVCLLKGAFMYFTDLVKRLNVKMILCEFIKISSYEGENSTQQVRIQGGFDQSKFANKHVLVIQDIADTGLTLKKFLNLVHQSKPADLKVSVLVNRPDKIKDYKIDYIGLECSDFIVGCGLDFDQFGRFFPAIYQKIDLNKQ